MVERNINPESIPATRYEAHEVPTWILDAYAQRVAKAFYEWALRYNVTHQVDILQAGKLPTVEELWEKYEQSQQKP